MEWVAVYIALIGANAHILDDLDGPNHFRRYRQCMGHAIKASKEMQIVLRDILPREPGLTVRWNCKRIGDRT